MAYQMNHGFGPTGYYSKTLQQQLADEEDDDDDPTILGSKASLNKGPPVPIWGNAGTMNINPLIVGNIQGSPYFKVQLMDCRTYQEVVDQIYYKVEHLEPWERGTRKTSNQTGMCGGVRGVGAGGVVSSAYCLMYKLSTMKITKKQLQGILNHCDSPYIRGVGFMFIRYAVDPKDIWSWYKDYMYDEEEIDVRAGGGKPITMGELCRHFLERLEWFDTRFPRIPVTVQREVNGYIAEMFPTGSSKPTVIMDRIASTSEEGSKAPPKARREEDAMESRSSRQRSRSRSPRSDRRRSRSRSRDRSHKRSRSRSKKEHKHKHKKDKKKKEKKEKKHKKRSSRSRSRSREGRGGSYEEELKKYSEHRSKQKKEKHKKRSRSRSRERDRA